MDEQQVMEYLEAIMGSLQDGLPKQDIKNMLVNEKQLEPEVADQLIAAAEQELNAAGQGAEPEAGGEGAPAPESGAGAMTAEESLNALQQLPLDIDDVLDVTRILLSTAPAEIDTLMELLVDEANAAEEGGAPTEEPATGPAPAPAGGPMM